MQRGQETLPGAQADEVLEGLWATWSQAVEQEGVALGWEVVVAKGSEEIIETRK